MDGGTQKKTRCRKRGLVLEATKEIFNLFDPDEANRGEQVHMPPLRPGRYRANYCTINFRGKEVVWIVVLDPNDEKLKGKAKRAWLVDVQAGGIIHVIHK